MNQDDMKGVLDRLREVYDLDIVLWYETDQREFTFTVSCKVLGLSYVDVIDSGHLLSLEQEDVYRLLDGIIRRAIILFARDIWVNKQHRGKYNV